MTFASTDLVIGDFSGDGSKGSDLLLDNIKIYSRVLTSTERYNLYHYDDESGCESDTAPEITLSSPAENSSAHEISPDFVFTPTDPQGDNMNCSLWVNGSSVSTTTGISNGTQTTITYTLPAWNYNYSWHINCTDGNETGVSDTWYYYPENSKPTVWIQTFVPAYSIDEDVYTSNNPEFFCIYVTDADSDTMNCSLYINGSVDDTKNSLSSTNTYCYEKDMSLISDGNYTWYWNCTDGNEIGLSSSPASAWWFVYDSINPTVSYTIPENTTLDFNFSLNVTDVNFANITVIDTCGGSQSFNDASVNVSIDALSCSYGSQTVSFLAYDLSGRNSSTSDIFFKLAYLNITAEDYSSVAVNGYYIYVDGVLYGNTSTDELQILDLATGTYNITIEPFDTSIQIKSEDVNITDESEAHTFTLYGSNSISITIYNEETAVQLATDNNFTYTYSGSDTVVLATGGDHYMENLTAGNYTLKFGGDGTYGIRYYYVTIPSRGHVELDAYVLGVATDELRNFIITCSGTAIEGALVTCQKSFSGTYKTVAQKYSDATGYASLYIDPDQEYQFIFYDDTYGTYTTTLTATSTPISINLCSGSTTQPYNWTPIFEYFSYLIYPQSSLIDPGVHNFSLIVSSPDGYMSDFGLYYGNYSGSVSGSPSGGSAYFSMNVTNLTSFTVYYYFNLTTGVNYSTSRVYYVDSIDAGNYSLYTVQADYISHFSPYLRYIIATIFALIVMVGARRYVNPLGTSFIGVGVLVVFALIQWISLVYIIPVAAIVAIYAVVDR
jgi:hypothetical protein